MLASDLNNPEFVGAIPNPDALMHVEFYMHKPLDKWQTEVASAKNQRVTRIYGAEQPFVRIMRPGDPTSVLEVPVREEHKQRWPEKWMYFQMSENLIDVTEIPGWKIEEWPYLLDKQDLLREMKYGRYSTVEQVAGASDAQCQRMGLGGVGIREQARADLRKKLSADINEAIASKDKEVADVKALAAAQAEQIKALTEQMARLTEAVTAPAPKAARG